MLREIGFRYVTAFEDRKPHFISLERMPPTTGTIPETAI